MNFDVVVGWVVGFRNRLISVAALVHVAVEHPRNCETAGKRWQTSNSAALAHVHIHMEIIRFVTTIYVMLFHANLLNIFV